MRITIVLQEVNDAHRRLPQPCRTMDILPC